MAYRPAQKPAITRNMRIRHSLVSGFLLIVIAGIVFAINQPISQKKDVNSTHTPSVQKVTPEDTYSYSGKDGIDALILLKQSAAIEQDTSGLVTIINKRKADASKREYWSFYINGKMSSVGPADYITKNSDILEWKVEIY